MTKGMTHQVLMRLQSDGNFVTHHRAKRHDLTGRLLDYTMRGEWNASTTRFRLRLLRFEIHEKGVTPQQGDIDAKDEYEILVLKGEELSIRSADGVVFHYRRVTSEFELPELPPPPAATKPISPDKTPFDAYTR